MLRLELQAHDWNYKRFKSYLEQFKAFLEYFAVKLV